METKVFQMKDADLKEDGSFTALFARFNDIDKQGDLTLPGAFGEQRVIISAYGHGSWNGVLPVGKGRIYETAEGGVVEAKFFLDTTAGRDTYTTIKNVGDLQEFSYSLPEIESEMRTIDGRNIRVLKKIRVNEVSPVLMGAGNATRLLDIKSSIPIIDHFEAVASDCRALVDRVKDVAQLREADGRHPSEATLKRTRALRVVFDDLIRELDRVSEKHDELVAEVLRFEQFRARRFA